ncbi:MAG: response regulator [Chloroflexi bacterium]|nr:response regulator [Chloroflexota bacterium]
MQSVRQRAERILIVDDDPGIAWVVGEHLRHAGYQVMAAADGAATLALARDTQPDLALVGQTLPDASGLEICRALASLNPAPATFVLATVVDREARLAALAAGAEALVAKPFDPVDLVARVGDHFAASHRGEPRHRLTGLPYHGTLDAAMQDRLDRRQPFHLLLLDLNGLRGYNASYGLARGDEALQRLADILRETVSLVGMPGDLIGHAGEDDLAVITTAPAAPLARRITALFDAIAADLAPVEDRQRGYSLSLNRQGQVQQHPLLRVSIGVVDSAAYPDAHPVELWQVAADVLTYARTLPGSAVHIDQRGGRARTGLAALPGTREVREARAQMAARAVDAGMLRLVGANLRAGLAELADVAELPARSAATLARLQAQVAVVQAQVQAAQGWRGFAPAPLDLAALLDEVVRSVRASAVGRHVDVRLASTPSVLLVVDGEKLIAALGALLHGLIDFTEPGGQVRVAADAERGRIVLHLTATRPAGDRAVLLGGLRTPAVTPAAEPLAGLALGRGLLAVLGSAVEPGVVTAEAATLIVTLPTNWHSTLDSVNTLEGALDDAAADARRAVQALEDDLSAGPATMEDVDGLRAHVAALQGSLKRLLVTANQLALLADEAAIASARATEAEARAAADTLTLVEALVEALERRCPSRLGHGRRVASLAVALGRRLRLAQAELTTLYRAGLLADVGLAMVDADLLNRPGNLTPAERLLVEAHVTAGTQLLRGTALLADALPAIAAHHERFDGGGFPERCAGAAIPLAGRILAVADAVVAMLSPRPYRPALAPEAVTAALDAGAGSQFDPTVVDAARGLLAEGSLARLAGASPAGVAPC